MFSFGTPRKFPQKAELDRATTPVIETLELRQLMSAATVRDLAGETEQSLIDLDTVAGVLKITSTGTSVAGSNTNGDNTLTNGLETQFNATTSGFKITTRLVGPLSYINTPSEQAGIMCGPDQDKDIKLDAISQPTST